MKKIIIRIAWDKNTIISSEKTESGELPRDSVETHLMIAGALDNLRLQHLEQLKTKFRATRKVDKGERSSNSNDNQDL